MIRDPLTGRWHPLPKELYMEQDHQSHVQLFHWNTLRAIALRHPLLTIVWTSPARSEHRYPTIHVDPGAYAGEGYANGVD